MIKADDLYPLIPELTLMDNHTKPLAQIEKDTLIKLYFMTNGKYWESSNNWLKGDPCLDYWTGIICMKSIKSEKATVIRM